MIAECLKHGRDNGIKMRVLCQVFKCGTREIRSQVHRERMAGAVILAGNDGFYLPSEDPETALQEIQAFERRMQAKASNTLAATMSATREKERLAGTVPPPQFFPRPLLGSGEVALIPEKCTTRA